MIRRIAITGPESTGKSWLAEKLAAHYKTEWVPEFAREYLDHLKRPYEQFDIYEIAAGQQSDEEEKERHARNFLFCDTDPLVTKIWSDVKYGSCDPRILSLVETHHYHLYLLCDVDLPWQFDPLREHPEMREQLFDLYLHELKSRNFPFFVISGSGNKRFQMAVDVIDKFEFVEISK
jgi:NadR type nicotinamide-nucleotide adenylyltransferase